MPGSRTVEHLLVQFQVSLLWFMVPGRNHMICRDFVQTWNSKLEPHPCRNKGNGSHKHLWTEIAKFGTVLILTSQAQTSLPTESDFLSSLCLGSPQMHCINPVLVPILKCHGIPRILGCIWGQDYSCWKWLSDSSLLETGWEPVALGVWRGLPFLVARVAPRVSFPGLVQLGLLVKMKN